MLPDRIRPSDILPMLRRSWWLVAVAVVFCVLGSVAVIALSTREYRSTAVIRIVPSQGQEVQSREVLDLDMRGFQEVERFYRTQVQLFKSKSFAERVVTQYNARTGKELKAGALIANLEVLPVERSQLVEISFTAEDPTDAAEVANLVADIFVAENIEWRRTMAREANRWVEEQLAEVERRREDIVQRSLSFKAEHDIVDIDSGGGALSARMRALEGSFGSVSTERVLLESRLAGHERLMAAGEFEALATLSQLPISEQLIEFYVTAKSDLATASARYGTRHPEHQRALANLDRAREELRRAVVEAIEGERARLKLLKAQEERLISERSATTDEVLERERLDAEYREIKRLLGQVEETHKTLLKRRDELELSAETKLNNAYPIDEAAPPVTFVRPRVSLTLAGGLVLGLFLGVSLALVRGYLDETIHSPADIESYVRLPLLGIIPHMDQNPMAHPELMAHLQPRSRGAEAMRGVRTMIENRPDGTRIRRVLVTSSIASEGKTSVAVQLATVFAQQGRPCLLVEGDHRRPRLHQVFGLTNERGVNEVLSGALTIDQAVVPTEIPGVSVLVRGSRPKDGVDLVSGEPLETLLMQLEDSFSMIILDTPPSVNLADAVTLSRHVDAVVLVARSGAVSRTLLRHTVRRLQQVGAAVAGVVLNDASSAGLTGSYKYYYGDNYYYAEERDNQPPVEAAK
jgi:capsular exopolysaccharide synthesis family protein